MKRCFVISPIGEEGSAVREHADDVYDYIIRPALHELDIQPVRSDHLREHGKISDQMFGAILNYELCIAILTGYNPNVFYEMAIAQCAARPIIILIEKGQELPFDVRDLRCVSYDLKPRSLFNGIYSREIVSYINAFEQAQWKVSVPFGAMIPLGGAVREPSIRFVERSADFTGPDDWLRILNETAHVFEIMAVNRSALRRPDGFSELLIEKARAGCQVRILLMHPENPTLPHYGGRTVPESSYDNTVREIEWMQQYYQAIADKEVNVKVRQARTGCFHVQLTRTDLHVIAVLCTFSRQAIFAPLWQCDKGTYLYETMTEEFESLWAANGPARDELARGTPDATPAARPIARPRRGRKGDERSPAGSLDASEST